MENKVVYQSKCLSVETNDHGGLIIKDMSRNNGVIEINAMIGGLGISTDIFYNVMNITSKGSLPVILVKGK